MTRIWLVNWHFQSRITLWCRHKSTNVSMRLCWQMLKFIVWRLWSIYFDHHLPLKPSIGKRRKQSCTPNTILTITILRIIFTSPLLKRITAMIFGTNLSNSQKYCTLPIALPQENTLPSLKLNILPALDIFATKVQMFKYAKNHF